MSSAAKIEFDYRRALEQAERLEEIAAKMRISRTELANSLDELRGGWDGEAASLYMRKGGVLREKIDRTSVDITNAAKTIRRIAKSIYNAEMAALEIARNRNY